LEERYGVGINAIVVTVFGQGGSFLHDHVRRPDCAEAVDVDVAESAFEAEDTVLAVFGAGVVGAGWGMDMSVLRRGERNRHTGD
jgi:hypothetical protein